ncbi:unnamed protein product, partial [Durusdinium trenchii]
MGVSGAITWRGVWAALPLILQRAEFLQGAKVLELGKDQKKDSGRVGSLCLFVVAAAARCGVDMAVAMVAAGPAACLAGACRMCCLSTDAIIANTAVATRTDQSAARELL